VGATEDEGFDGGLDEDEGGEEYKDKDGGGVEDEDGEGEGEGAGPELEIPNCVVYWYCPVASTINWIP